MNRPGQGGMTLLLSLLILTVLSLLALAAASDSVLQERVTRNLDLADRSLRSADSATAWGEDWLLATDGTTRPLPCISSCGLGDVIRALNGYPRAPEYESGSWWAANGNIDGENPVNGTTLADRSGDFEEPGRWIVEEVWFEPHEYDPLTGTSYYRIIARGAQTGSYAAVSESILARPWGDPEWSDELPTAADQATFCQALAIEGPCGRLAWRQRK